MPLHAEQEVTFRMLHRLHDIVQVPSRDPQPRAEAVDALLVQAVDFQESDIQCLAMGDVCSTILYCV